MFAFAHTKPIPCSPNSSCTLLPTQHTSQPFCISPVSDTCYEHHASDKEVNILHFGPKYRFYYCWIKVKKHANAKEFGIPNEQYLYIGKVRKQKIVTELESGAVNVERKELKKGKYTDIKDALLQWVKDLRGKSIPVTSDGKKPKSMTERLVFQINLCDKMMH